VKAPRIKVTRYIQRTMSEFLALRENRLGVGRTFHWPPNSGGVSAWGVHGVVGHPRLWAKEDHRRPQTNYETTWSSIWPWSNWRQCRHVRPICPKIPRAAAARRIASLLAENTKLKATLATSAWSSCWVLHSRLRAVQSRPWPW